MEWAQLVLLAIIAFALNVPLGQWRSRQRRLSPRWLLGIHASIPLVILLRRYAFDLPIYVIPVEVAAIVLGQTLGAQWGHVKRRYLASKEAMGE